MITAKAPGKMILIGEYAVLYGAKALVCAMDCYASVKWAPSKNGRHTISAPTLSIDPSFFEISGKGIVTFENQENSDTIKKLYFFKIVYEQVAKIIQSGRQEIQAADIEINTGDFYSADGKYKYGFGSSAAMTVALVEALLNAANLRGIYNTNEFFQLAFNIHRIAQGNLGSGIDIAASVYGNVLTYHIDSEDDIPVGRAQSLDRWDELFILPVWIGESVSTPQMVRSVDTLKASSPKIFDKIMEALMCCSENGCDAYTRKDMPVFFESVREFNGILAELGKRSNTPIISDAHRKLIDLISGIDAVYKPSGAGGGDIGVVFCSSADIIENVKQILLGTEFQILDIGIARNGVQFTK